MSSCQKSECATCDLSFQISCVLRLSCKKLRLTNLTTRIIRIILYKRKGTGFSWDLAEGFFDRYLNQKSKPHPMRYELYGEGV